jgi:hypothetical protein
MTLNSTPCPCIITEGGLTNDEQRKWVDIPFIPFDKLRQLWKKSEISEILQRSSKSEDLGRS